MIRIMTASTPHATTVTVDGDVAGEYLDAIDTCVKQAIGKGRAVRLFLRDVTSIDARGRDLLARLAASGVHLRANGVYSSYVAAEISRSATSGNLRSGSRGSIAEIPAVRRQPPSLGQGRPAESTTSGGEPDAVKDSGMRIRRCG
jgi:hypothetical protein